MNTVDYIYSDLRKIVDNVVVKYDRLAKDGESIESKRNADRYVTAMKKMDNFNSYSNFSKEAIANAGVTDLSLIEKYYKDKYTIPQDKRDDIVKAQREIIINNYVEGNDYYREMIGLPNKNDTDYFYAPPEVCRLYSIDPLTPIHALSKDEIYRLERYYLPTLISQNPDKKYLRFLGSKSVDLVAAREAKNFDIIATSLDFNNVFLSHFFSTYSLCREYFTSVIYVKEFSSSYDLYDNFIALNIMIMTIQRMMVNTFRIGVERDFYDLSSIKTLFDSYGVPFFEELPLDYQRSIMKNLNMLLRYKSTDKVLYDISSILFFDRIQIFKYFLMKERVLDDDDNPIFAYKEVMNEDGEIEIVEDVEKMYRFYFQSTDVLERNTALALENKQNKIEFYDVTESDPLWWNDEDLQKELYEREFNYVETKYMSVNIMYKMTQMMFESIYALNMMVDKKESETKYIYIDLPRVTLDKVSVFDSIILLCALTSKKNGMKGEIISTPTKILSVLGFNFNADFKAIIENIEKNSRFVDQNIIKYIKNMDLKSASDINDMYNNINELMEFCVYKINNSHSLKEYKAYKDIYEALMVKEYTTDILKKSNGKVASTYLDYLKDKNPVLADFVNSCEKNSTGIYIKHILGKLNELIPKIEYMNAVEGSDSIMVKALLKLIEFFKSYTVDLESLNVLYLMDSKYYNTIRMVHDINTLSKVMQPVDKAFTQYFDKVIRHATITRGDAVEFMYKYFIKCKSLYKYLHRLICDMHEVGKIDELTDKMNMEYIDRSEFDKIMEDELSLEINEMDVYSINIDEEDKLSLSDLLKSIAVLIFANEKDIFTMYNDQVHIIKNGDIIHTMKVEDLEKYHGKIFYNIILDIQEKYELVANMSFQEKLAMDFTDVVVGGEKDISTQMEFDVFDKYKSYISIHRNDTQKYRYSLKSSTQALVKKVMTLANIIKGKSDMELTLDLNARDWYNLYRNFTQIENGIPVEEFSLNTLSNHSDNISDYTDFMNYIKDISVKNKMTLSELCKMYYNLSHRDDANIYEKFNIGIKHMISSVVKSIDALDYSKHVRIEDVKIPLKELYDIQRSIYRSDKYLPREKKSLSVEMLHLLNIDLEEDTSIDKESMVKFKKDIEEKVKIYFRHNFTIILKFEEILSKSELNMHYRESLEIVYNNMLDNMYKLVDLSESNLITYSEAISRIKGEIDLILKAEEVLKSFDSIAFVNEAINSAFFNRLLGLSLLEVCESINMNKHEIFESFKDLFTLYKLSIEEKTDFMAILYDNDSIEIYNDQVNNIFKNELFKYNYSFKETLAVIYE